MDVSFTALDFQIFLLEYLSIVIKLCETNCRKAHLDRARLLKAQLGNTCGDFSPKEIRVFRSAASALEPYGYDDSDSGTASAIKRLAADLRVQQQIEEFAAQVLAIHISQLFGQDELSEWDSHLRATFCGRSEHPEDAYELALARRHFFERYFADHGENCRTRPSLIEETFRLSEQNLFFSLTP